METVETAETAETFHYIPKTYRDILECIPTYEDSKDSIDIRHVDM